MCTKKNQFGRAVLLRFFLLHSNNRWCSSTGTFAHFRSFDFDDVAENALIVFDVGLLGWLAFFLLCLAKSSSETLSTFLAASFSLTFQSLLPLTHARSSKKITPFGNPRWSQACLCRSDTCCCLLALRASQCFLHPLFFALLLLFLFLFLSRGSSIGWQYSQACMLSLASNKSMQVVDLRINVVLLFLGSSELNVLLRVDMFRLFLLWFFSISFRTFILFS